MKPKFGALLERCIEDGTRQGITRAHKHNDNPTTDQLVEEVLRGIANELYAWFEFEDGESVD